jgi:hypothetical protein
MVLLFIAVAMAAKALFPALMLFAAVSACLLGSVLIVFGLVQKVVMT